MIKERELKFFIGINGDFIAFLEIKAYIRAPASRYFFLGKTIEENNASFGLLFETRAV